MHRKHYIIVAVLIVCALIGGMLLMPGRAELALMQLKDKHFEEARKAYEEQLSQGTLSLEVASHLTDLYLQVGAVDKAIAIMEKYVAAHPDSLDARQKLGTLYQYAQRQDDYIKNLEEINKLTPKTENLKVLSDTYNFKGQYDKQAAMLKDLIKSEQGRDAKHFMDLASVQVAMKAYPDAIATLQELRKTHPDQFDFNACALLVSLLLDSYQPQEAFNIANDWISTHHNDEQSAQLINTIHFKGSTQMAASLIEHFSDDQINASPALLEEFILLEIAEGKEDDAYHRLKALNDNGRLPPLLTRRLMFMAEARGDKELAHSLLNSTDLTTYSEAELLSLIVLAEDQHDPELLNQITKAFPEATNDNTHPVLMAGLAVSNHWASAESRLSQLDTVALTTEQALQLASLCAHTGRYSCTDHLLSRMPDMDKMSDADIAFVGNLYYQMHAYEKGANYIRQAQVTHHSSLIDAEGAQFAAVRGEGAEVKRFIDTNPDAATPRLFADLYFGALNNGHLHTALMVAELYHDKFDTTLSRSLLANAYIKSVRYEDGLRLLRNVNPRSEDDENNYLTALTHLAPRNPQYHKELAEYAGARLHSGVSKQQKLALVYALVNARETDVAMPYVRELALSEGGQWAILYANELEREGKYDEARQFWLRVAEQPSATREQKQSIAYALLDHGDKKDAERLFMELAANQPANSEAVNDLLYIWGPRPSLEEMQWIEDRYTQASGNEKMAWAKVVSDYANSGFVAGFVRRHPESLNNPTIAQDYFQILANNGKLGAVSESYVAYTERTGNTALMRIYGQVADNNGLPRETRIAYETIAKVDKTDYESLRQAGVMAYSQADYVGSKQLLGSYIQHSQAGDVKNDPLAYRAYFFYGEMLRHAHQVNASRPYYQTVITLVRASQSPEALSMKAQSQIWSGDINGGLQTFNQAHSLYPNNEDLRSDYIGTLIDLKQYDAARALIPPAPTQAPKTTMAMSALPSFNQPVQSYTLLENGNEILVQFAQPLKNQTPPLSQAMVSVPGVAYASEGYDTLLLGVKSGYKFSVNSDAQTASVQIVPDTGIHTHDDATLRYALFDARIDLETGHVYRAAQKLNALIPQYKDNAQLLAFTANAENYGGNWSQAEALLSQARALSPDDQDLQELDRDARREHAQNVTLDYEWMRLGHENENIATLRGYVDAAAHLQIGARLQNNWVQVRQSRLANGDVGDFNGQRHAGEVYAQYYAQNGQVARVAVFGNDVKAGVGAYYHFLTPLGETQLTGEYRKPYWDLVEAAYDDATRDRIAIQQIYKPTPRWTLSIEPGLNRYDTSFEDNVLTTFSLGGTAVYRLIDGNPTSVDVGYELDAEYDRTQKEDYDQFGDYTRLLPLNSREIHMLFGDVSHTFSERTYGDILLGGQYDRLNGTAGPVVEGKITHEFTPTFDMQLRGYYGLDATNTDSYMSFVGAYARYRF